MWKRLGVLVLIGCAETTPSPQTPPASEDTEVKVTPPAAPTPSKQIVTTDVDPTPVATPTTITCGKTRRQSRFDFDAPADAPRSNLLGISAPAPPGRAEVNSHVRREGAVSKSAPDLAKAIDGATIDTSSCQALAATKRDASLELEVAGGAVKSITRKDDGDELLRCVMQSLCTVSLGSASGTATVAFHLRPMTDRPAVKPKSGTATSPQKAMIEVVSEAAAACEQGQKLGSKSTSGVVTVGATPHSTVAPTMTISFPSTTGMNKCMTERIDGFRLPLSPWTNVGTLDLEVTWDG